MHGKRRTVPSVGVKYRAVLSLIFFPSEKPGPLREAEVKGRDNSLLERIRKNDAREEEWDRESSKGSSEKRCGGRGGGGGERETEETRPRE